MRMNLGQMTLVVGSGQQRTKIVLSQELEKMRNKAVLNSVLDG